LFYLDAYEEEKYYIAHANINVDSKGKILEEIVEAPL
jgi:DNA-directed RNA polymerase beta subunit